MNNDEHVTTISADAIREAFLRTLRCGLGRPVEHATEQDVYQALALTVREQTLDRGVGQMERVMRESKRIVGYLSAEFLPGPHLANSLLALGAMDAAREAMTGLGFDLGDIFSQEEEPGLGNGGLGRLASCYMDSMAALRVPAIGYGIRYEFGIFDQRIEDGWQVEITDKWLRFGNPWELVRHEFSYRVGFGGTVRSGIGEDGVFRAEWVPSLEVRGVACDTPVPGFGGGCSILRLWKGEAIESFDFAAFNHGDYFRAVEDKVESENLTKVLYPNDDFEAGRELRLRQQVFFCSCSLQDMLRIHMASGNGADTFHERWAVQLNDTHPAIAVAELMRLLLDVHGMGWEEAWAVTQRAIAYTNHTLLPEALEKWPVPMFSRLLPRHYQIILEINHRFLAEVRAAFPDDEDRVARMSLIDESGSRYVRMANLATVAAYRVNGVARLHSELLRETVLRDFAEMWPEKFLNVTNGVTPRRFVALSNPALARLIDKSLGGDGWLLDLGRLREMEPLADDEGFRQAWRDAKLEAKRRLAAVVAERTGIKIDPAALFDVQVKRLHEYKRQHLNALHILALYRRIKRNPSAEVTPRVFLFGAKAAPGYFMAKRIIKFINAIGALVNDDSDVAGRLKVVFFPDYNVKNAQLIYPVADLSEQISTAGKEASGTGNMKFALNGALTIGTLDGANVEIREEVGQDNFFLFGLDVTEVEALKRGGYRPEEFIRADHELADTLEFAASGALASGDCSLFQPLVDNLRFSDPFLVCADFRAYADCQLRVDSLWGDRDAWTRASILNTARMSKFSSDRSIRDYCRDIWQIGV